MRVPGRPGRGGKSEAGRTRALSSLGSSIGATIALDVVAQPEGFSDTNTASETVMVQVATG